MNAGKYIVIEGHDGTGKGTQANLLIAALEKQGVAARYAHEPGETAIGLVLEGLIKDATIGRTALSNFLMFTINRIELWQQLIHPNLEAGTWVIADRSWVSSAAYQGFAEGLGIDFVEQETRKYMPVRYMSPDILFGIQLDEEIRTQRVQARGGNADDTFESKNDDFQHRISKGYDLALGSAAIRIDGSGSPAEVHSQIWAHVSMLAKPQNADIAEGE
jgi:dTMP kinase